MVSSLTNHLMGSSGQEPEVGMGVTVFGYSDRHAGTITRVSASKREFWFRHDIAARTDANGMSDSQTYEFTPDPAAPEIRVKLSSSKKHPGWKCEGGRVAIGYRSEYYDYSF